MSRRRVAALAAVIIVPVALLAIVLGSVLDSGDDGAPSQTAQTQTTAPAPTGKRLTPKGSSSSGSGRTLGESGGASLQVLDRGSVPERLSGRLGDAAPGSTISLGRLRGGPVVLNVWSSDCTPCRAEAHTLQSEWLRLGPRGVLFLGLNVGDSPAAAKRFRAENDITYPSLEEKRGETARALGSTGAPETFFISKSGKVVGHVVGTITLGQIELGVRAAQTGQSTGTDEGGGRVPLP
jgi:peroxiredoxin